MAVTLAMRKQITQLYVSLFGRAPETEGLGYWASQLDAGVPIATIAQQMYDVPPTRAYYPLFLTDEEIITKFYQNVLGRSPDPEGLAYWTSKMLTGTKGSVFVDIITAVVNTTGALGVAAIESQTLFNDKVIAGLDYANTGGTSTSNNILVVLSDYRAAQVDMANAAAAAAIVFDSITDQDGLTSAIAAGNARYTAYLAEAAGRKTTAAGVIADAAIANGTTPEMAAVAVVAASTEATLAAAFATAADDAVSAAKAFAVAAAATRLLADDDVAATATSFAAAQKIAATAAVVAAAADVAAATLLSIAVPAVVVATNASQSVTAILHKQDFATTNTLLIDFDTNDYSVSAGVATIPDIASTIWGALDNIEGGIRCNILKVSDAATFVIPADTVASGIDAENFAAEVMGNNNSSTAAEAVGSNQAILIGDDQNIKLTGLLDLSVASNFITSSSGLV